MSGHITLRPPYVKDRDKVAQVIHNILPYEYTLAQALDLVNSQRKFVYVKSMHLMHSVKLLKTLNYRAWR